MGGWRLRARRAAPLRALERSFRHHWIGFDFHIDVGSFFQLNFVPTRIRQTVWNPNFSIEVVCPLDRNLRLFRFAGTGMRVNNFFDSAWESSTSFRFFSRHDWESSPSSWMHTDSAISDR